mmetsp:Transcript_29955/g.96643  ORF Transcript_29955/g.96643 Transcript_29955/m.96643 type:complete len:213 (-) Transcript_29955:78-716(-)
MDGLGPPEAIGNFGLWRRQSEGDRTSHVVAAAAVALGRVGRRARGLEDHGHEVVLVDDPNVEGFFVVAVRSKRRQVPLLPRDVVAGVDAPVAAPDFAVHKDLALAARLARPRRRREQRGVQTLQGRRQRRVVQRGILDDPRLAHVVAALAAFFSVVRVRRSGTDIRVGSPQQGCCCPSRRRRHPRKKPTRRRQSRQEAQGATASHRRPFLTH